MPRTPSVLRPAAAVVLTLTIAACGDRRASVEPTPRDLSVPWQAEPFPVETALAVQAAELCRTEVIPIEDPTPLAIVDARGENILQLVFADSNSHYDCRVEREAGGLRLSGGSNGGGGSSGVGPPAVAPNLAVVGSVHPVDEFHVDPARKMASIATGRTGPGVVGVDLILLSGTRIRASTANGEFVAWWPTAEMALRIQGFGPGGFPLGEPHD